MNFNIVKIGEVKSQFTDPVGPEEMKDIISEIIIKKEYADGLYKIEEKQIYNGRICISSQGR